MTLALILAVVLSQAAPPPAGPSLPPQPGQAKGARGKAPTHAETAQLYFLAGDVAKATEWARRGVKKEPRTCKPLLKLLAEYGFLAAKRDSFTPREARDFVALDKKISPRAMGQLTEPIYGRFVLGGLAQAKRLATGNNHVAAHGALDTVLIVDPKNGEARALKAALDPLADEP